MKYCGLFFRALLLLIVVEPCISAALNTYSIEEMTSTEVGDAVRSGKTTILIPVGGTEQNGPLIVLGKHNVRVKNLSGKIALRLGNALVAPVMSYVPEGKISPPAAHMRFAGTISISETAFEAVLESTARSMKQHGFRHVIFLGDHGGYQSGLKRVADKLNRQWKHDPACRVYAIDDYYRVTQTSYVDALKSKGFSDSEIGTHAGLADTALSLAVDKGLVRGDQLAMMPVLSERDGVFGDPRKATAESGEIGVKLIVDASVAAIQAAIKSR